jgi:hypothetical protein
MHGSVHVGFVVDKVALGQVLFQILWFSPVNIIPPLLIFGFPLSTSFHHCFIIWGMNNRPIRDNCLVSPPRHELEQGIEQELGHGSRQILVLTAAEIIFLVLLKVCKTYNSIDRSKLCTTLEAHNAHQM